MEHEKIRELVAAGEFNRLDESFSDMQPIDIADILSDTGPDLLAGVLQSLDAELAADVLTCFDDHLQEALLEHLDSKHLTEIVDEMETDDAADVIGTLSPEQAEEVIRGIDSLDGEHVRELLTYDKDTAGGLMQAEFVAVPGNLTATKALAEVRNQGSQNDQLHNVFIVDEEDRFLGMVALNQMVFAEPDSLVASLVDGSPLSLKVTEDQEEVARFFSRYDLVSAPVVDDAGVLVGRVTIDDVVDVMEEEASEDIYHMAGMMAGETVFDSPAASIKKRLPWLCTYMLLGTLTIMVVAHFKSTIEAAFIAPLLPFVAGMGGNTGTQTLALMVRGIALGQIDARNGYRALMKEICVGVVNGIVIGAISGGACYLILNFMNFEGINPMMGVVLGIAMMLVFVMAALSGTAIPLLLMKMGVDPALASGIFVTTSIDILGMFTFLGLATVYLRIAAG
ncbi:magnesium transporter [Candidatus Hydrogenedentota bacterium]